MEHACTVADRPQTAGRAVPVPDRPDTEALSDRPGREALPNEELVELYRRNQCVACLDILLTRNEDLLHKVLQRFSYAREPYEDLFQVARMGLIKAAQRFDGERGTAFTTYAVAVVDGEIRHHLRDCLLVRQPRWVRSLYGKIRDAQNEFFRTEGRSPTLAELSKRVNVREEGVLEIIRAYGATNLHSWDEPFDDTTGSTEPDRRLIRSVRRETFALPVEDKIALQEAVKALSDFQRKLVYLLFFKDLTQEEAAAELGMSQRKVSREQTKALSRLKAILNKKVF